ncbi:protein-disulfide reductase DsbD [Pseudomonas saliphila]|uniref:protein-disulfide reductase DsbD n=1 Tax=Pseudomonas saliphila TaxID=2586906 RepID=UPI001F196829|nr:protein-disulfide reductase DsbD [Pseudomonas saliphila]
MLLRRLLLLLCLLAATTAQGQFASPSNQSLGGLLNGSGGQSDFLPVHEAFRPGIVDVTDSQLRVQFDIAPEYYLYRHRLAFKLLGGDGTIAQVILPDGEHKTDEYFGDVEVYYDQLEAVIELAPGSDPATQLEVGFQGCADAGLCYPPETVVLELPDAGNTASDAAAATGTGTAVGSPGMQDLLTGDRFELALLLFFVAGLGLTFTPCVLPMLPILSSLVLGRKDIDRTRAFILALSYVLGMAISFALVGALIGLFGAALNIQARLQSPWVLGTFAVFFVVFALAMFGLFELRLPAFMREPLERLGSRTRGGSVPGAAVMGVLSTLVVSPCISAPLAGALIYIGATGDALGGAASLFALALGMGLPLLLVAVFGSALLPRSGAWLDNVKQLFGFGLLGVSIWLLERILPGPVSLALWAALTAGIAVQLGLFDRTPRNGIGRVSQTLALLAAFYSGAALLGALAGGFDPLRPLQPFTGTSVAGPATSSAYFTRVTDQAALQRQLDDARAAGAPAVVEVYADWCISCKVFEREVLSDPSVRSALDGFTRIKFDLTDNTPDQREWLSAQSLFGPPAFVFFDANGQDVSAARIQGEVTQEEFLARVSTASR